MCEKCDKCGQNLPEKVNCAMCAGTGKVHKTVYTKCDKCGSLHGETKEFDCSYCKGTGKVKIYWVPPPKHYPQVMIYGCNMGDYTWYNIEWQ